MTWAEYCIRSFAFKRQREWEMMMAREVSYEVFTLKYMFGKTKPPKKSKFWPVTDEERGKKGSVTEEMIQAFEKEWKKYEETRKNNEQRDL